MRPPRSVSGVLSDLAKRRAFHAHVLDLGCGTGLLAIGAVKLWKRTVIASDIDPVAIEVTRENAGRQWRWGDQVAAFVADGLTHPRLQLAVRSYHRQYPGWATDQAGAPESRASSGTGGGVLVLSGLLRNQENMVLSFYQGLKLKERRREGPWSALVLEKPER